MQSKPNERICAASFPPKRKARTATAANGSAVRMPYTLAFPIPTVQSFSVTPPLQSSAPRCSSKISFGVFFSPCSRCCLIFISPSRFCRQDLPFRHCNSSRAKTQPYGSACPPHSGRKSRRKTMRRAEQSHPTRFFHIRNFSEPRYGKTARTLFPGKEIRAVLLLGLVDKNATFNNTLNIRPLRFYRQEPEIHWRSTTRIRIAIYVLNLSTNLYI